MKQQAWQIIKDSKVIVIGDVHGYYNTLMALLNKIKHLYPDYKIIFLGDLIDKGKRSKEVVSLVKNNYISLLGNHDRHMGSENNPKYWKYYDSLWMQNNGKGTTIRSYGKKYRILKSKTHREDFYQDSTWIRTLPLVIELPNVKLFGKPVLLSHAPLNKSIEVMGCIGLYKKFLSQDINNLWNINLLNSYVNDSKLENYSKEHISLFYNLYNCPKDIKNIDPISNYHNVFGHIHLPDYYQDQNYSMIDTTVYGPNKLTALVLPENKIIQQDTIEDTWLHKS